MLLVQQLLLLVVVVFLSVISVAPQDLRRLRRSLRTLRSCPRHWSLVRAVLRWQVRAGWMLLLSTLVEGSQDVVDGHHRDRRLQRHELVHATLEGSTVLAGTGCTVDVLPQLATGLHASAWRARID